MQNNTGRDVKSRTPQKRLSRTSLIGIPRHSSMDPEISLIIPCFNEVGNIQAAISAIGEEMAELKNSYEIIVVDDGSRDETVRKAREMIADFPVRVVCLSRNFGKENAITAGLERSRGNAVIIIDADLQEPISYLKTFIEHWKQGFEMVYAVRANRQDETVSKRLGARLFYWVLNHVTTVKIPPNARDFRLMDRKVVNALCKLPERNRFMKGLYGWVGFKTMKIPIMIDKRNEGVSKFNYKRLFDLAITGLTSFSDIPLRLWTVIGIIISGLSIFYAAFITLKTLLYGSPISGWPTIAVAILFLGGIQIFSIGILGEYISRIFCEVKARPIYIVSDEYNDLDPRD